MSTNIAMTSADAVLSPTYEPLPSTVQYAICRGPNHIATSRIGSVKPTTVSATPLRPRRFHNKYTTGSSTAAPVCFASVAHAAATPADVPWPRRASTTAATIAGSMKISKFAAWPSWGAKATSATTVRNPAIHIARGPARRRASNASSNAVATTASMAATRTVHSAVVPVSAKVAA